MTIFTFALTVVGTSNVVGASSARAHYAHWIIR